MASAGGGIIVTGDKEVDRLLAGMEAKLQKKITRQATRKAAKDIVLPEAKNRVPVDTGDLEESLVVRAIKRSRSRFGHEVGTRDGFFRGDEFYGAFIEFGTKERQHKSGKNVGRIDPAKNFSYLRTAVYDNQPRIREAFNAALREFISEAAQQ